MVKSPSRLKLVLVSMFPEAMQDWIQRTDLAGEINDFSDQLVMLTCSCIGSSLQLG